MNIVKLKDKVMPNECSFANFFNEKLKGKYAYWIQMRYIFPLDSMDYITYIKYEQLDDIDFLKPDILPHIDLYTEECCMYEFSYKYIDHNATSISNTIRINDYKIANNYVSDPDIDISDLRNFRSWLANELLLLNTAEDGTYLNNLTENQIHMLEYYKNDMYNDVVKQLNIFGKDNAFTITSANNCGCCSINTSGLYNLTNSYVCNALDTYVKNLHILMVQTFEDINFWLCFNKEFISVFKKYIDNIIKTGLIINKPVNSNLYIGCNCNSLKDASNIILRNLSEALQYIIDDEYNNHINFITDS